MFSFLVPQVVSVPHQPKKITVPTKDDYESAKKSYRSRHPETTEDDFALIRKEGGDLECLHLWGATPEDMKDAEIIARYDPNHLPTPAETDIHQPSTEEKATEQPFHVPKVIVEPVIPMTPLREQTIPLPTPPSLSLPTFTVIDVPNEPVLNKPAPPAPMLFIPSFLNLSQPPPVTEIHPLPQGNAPQPPPQPSLFLPNFILFNETASTTLPSQSTEEVHNVPASTSLFLPAFFDISPRSVTPSTAKRPPPQFDFKIDPVSTVPSTPSSMRIPSGTIPVVHLPSQGISIEGLPTPSVSSSEEKHLPGLPAPILPDITPALPTIVLPTQPSNYIYFTVFDSKIPETDVQSIPVVDPSNLSTTPTNVFLKVPPVESITVDGPTARDLTSLIMIKADEPPPVVQEKVVDTNRLTLVVPVLSSGPSNVSTNTVDVNGPAMGGDVILMQEAEIAKLRQQLTAANNAIVDLAVEGRVDKANTREAKAEVERLQQQLAEMERKGKTLQKQLGDSQKSPPTSPNDVMLTQLQRSNDRNRELETQNQTAAAAMDDMFAQLAALTRQKVALEDQAKDDQATIAFLRVQLADEKNRNSALAQATAAKAKATPPAAVPAAATASFNNILEAAAVDRRRVKDLKEVNDTLSALAADTSFQQDLKRPLVAVALTAWSGASVTHIPADQLEGARFDEGVARIYPKLKAFEKVCDAAKIQFPVDHITLGKKELSPQAVAAAFGPDFFFISN